MSTVQNTKTSSEPPQAWTLSWHTSSTLTKVIRIALFLLLGAAAVVGALSYFRLLHPYYLYGAIGVAAVSIVSLILSCLSKKTFLTKDHLVLGNLRPCYDSACKQAIQKLSSSRFQKIGICMSKGSDSEMYFGDQDGHLRDLRFEACPNGSVLVIRMADEPKIADRIKDPRYFGVCVTLQNGRLKDFVDRGHQHIVMGVEDCDYLLRNNAFPPRIRNIISG